METLNYSRLYLEDLDIGSSVREVRLADGRVVLAQQIHPGNLAIIRTTVLLSSAGAATLTASGFLLAGMRVLGVTTQVLYTLGVTQGMTSYIVGDGTTIDRWGESTALSAGAKTEQLQFRDPSWPVYASNTDVVLSAVAGLFDGVGQVEVTAHYFPLLHRSAR